MNEAIPSANARFASRMFVDGRKGQVPVDGPHVAAGASRSNIDLECGPLKDTRLDAHLVGCPKK